MTKTYRGRPNEVRRSRRCLVCSHKFLTKQAPGAIAEEICERISGQTHPNAKLDNDKVIAMRQYAAEGASSFECSLVWDVSQKVAWNAIVGRTWKHVK